MLTALSVLVVVDFCGVGVEEMRGAREIGIFVKNETRIVLLLLRALQRICLHSYVLQKPVFRIKGSRSIEPPQVPRWVAAAALQGGSG